MNINPDAESILVKQYHHNLNPQQERDLADQIPVGYFFVTTHPFFTDHFRLVVAGEYREHTTTFKIGFQGIAKEFSTKPSTFLRSFNDLLAENNTSLENGIKPLNHNVIKLA